MTPTPGAPPPRGAPRPVRPPPRKTSPLGWMVLSTIMGMGLGGACVTCTGAFDGSSIQELGKSDFRVGVVELTGPITQTKEVVQQIRKFHKNDGIDALLIRIDSPGGAVAPSQEVYDALRQAAKKKPVVASMGGVAASGGFWAAMGADEVFASPGTVTGSIGVISQTPDLRQLADLLRLNMRTFRSGPLKDLGNPLRAMTAQDEQVFMDLLNDIYDQFVSVVAERRGLDVDAVLRLADGRVMTGRAAHDAGLIDALGGLHDAARRAASLAAKKRAEEEGEPFEEPEGDPTLIYPPRDRPSLLELLGRGVGSAFARGALEQAGDSAGEALRDWAFGRVNVELR